MSGQETEGAASGEPCTWIVSIEAAEWCGGRRGELGAYPISGGLDCRRAAELAVSAVSACAVFGGRASGRARAIRRAAHGWVRVSEPGEAAVRA